MGPIATIAVGLLLGLGGCGDDNESDEPEAEAEDQGIAYSKTGGIAGIAQRIQITEDGEAVVVSGNVDPVKETTNVEGSQLAALNAELDAAGFDDMESPGDDTGCADCFVYVLERGEHSIKFDDTNLPEDLAKAVAALEKLIAANVEPVK